MMTFNRTTRFLLLIITVIIPVEQALSPALLTPQQKKKKTSFVTSFYNRVTNNNTNNNKASNDSTNDTNNSTTMTVASSSTSADSIPSLEERWSETNVNGALELWGQADDPKYKTMIRQIQELIVDDVGDYWKNDPYEVVGYLQDFPNWSPSKIADLFKEMVQYRLDNNIDTLMDRYTPPQEMSYMPVFMLREMDRDGDPIYVTRVGAWKAMDMLNDPRIGPDGLIQYTQFLQEYIGTRWLGQNVPKSWNWQTEYFEKNINGINPTRRRYKQFTSVFDMEGLNWSQHLKSELFKVMSISSRRGQDYYAGTAKRIIVLRAPRLFKMGWNMVKHFVDPQMQELIEFSSGNDYLEVWDKYMTRDSLPTCMGNPDPTRNDCHEMLMPGYFSHVKMEGGSIPQHIPYKDIKKETSSSTTSRRMETASMTDDESVSGGDEQPTLSQQPKVNTRSFSLLRGHLDPTTDQVVFQN